MKILLYAVVDVIGMLFFATGATWLVRRQSLLIPDFPKTMTASLAVSAVGLLLMLWAAGQILREMIKQPVSHLGEGK